MSQRDQTATSPPCLRNQMPIFVPLSNTLMTSIMPLCMCNCLHIPSSIWCLCCHWGSGSRDSEDVAVVCCCLVVSCRQSVLFLVVSQSIPPLGACFPHARACQTASAAPPPLHCKKTPFGGRFQTICSRTG